MSDDVNWISVPDADEEDAPTNEADDAGETDAGGGPGRSGRNGGTTTGSPDADTTDGDEDTPEGVAARVRREIERRTGGDAADNGDGNEPTSGGQDPDAYSGGPRPDADPGRAPYRDGTRTDLDTDSAVGSDASRSTRGTGTSGPEEPAAGASDTHTRPEGSGSTPTTARPVDAESTEEGLPSPESVEQRVKELIHRQADEDGDGAGSDADTDGREPPEVTAEERDESTGPELFLVGRSNGDDVDTGDHPGEVRPVDDPTRLRSVLTERRIELVESVMAERPPSIRSLADRLDRDVKDVHGDLHHLAEFGVVEFEENGRAKQPTVPYDRVWVRVGIAAGGEDAGG